MQMCMYAHFLSYYKVMQNCVYVSVWFIPHFKFVCVLHDLYKCS
jgi:hypothetical protein